MRRHFAPAGTPVDLASIALGAAGGSLSSGAMEALSLRIARLSGSSGCLLMSSGRAAMTVLMSAMRELGRKTGRDEIVVPGYTCYSVPAAVLRAGLKVRLCDVNPHTLGIDPDALRKMPLGRTAAIVSANLYGIPDDLVALESIAAEQGAWLVDDAAQALGARLDGRPVGGFGSVGIYSFDKGKNITTIQGGAAVFRSLELEAAFHDLFERLPSTGPLATAVLTAKLAAYSIALRPLVYERIQRIGALGLGRTIYEDDFPVCKYSPTLSGIALRLLHRLDAINGARIDNAKRLEDALGSVAGVRLVDVAASAKPVYARYPVLIDDPEHRAASIDALRRGGIGATGSYPSALCDVPEVAPHLAAEDRELPGARQVARTIVTLPTHAYCPRDLAERVAREISATRC